MEAILVHFVRLLFILFLAYTVFYLIQTGLSLCISLYELSDAQKRKNRIHKIFPQDAAAQAPVSVIIPSHNEAACICETVDSLICEDYPNLEIIIVNDGSSDHTDELVIHRYGLEKADISFSPVLKTASILQCWSGRAGDKSLILVSKENGGKADALNCGLNLCSNSLCVMLDADTKVMPDSIRVMASRFMMDNQIIACAGVVSGGNLKYYPKLLLRRKMLVLFQILEYYRTFYTQRVLFDRLNANIIISGAFAMFDANLVKQAGGYQTDTIGEDMELTMRLHSFCISQKKPYKIAYAPEAKCTTQFPFTFRDYFQQRRRWQIGMLQSMKLHGYMLGNWQYGWAGMVSGSFFILYELFSPLCEILGIATLAAANALHILNLSFTMKAMIAYAVVILLMQVILVAALHVYNAEQQTLSQVVLLFLISLLEIVFFHPLNVMIKVIATLTSYRNKKTWKHLRRTGKKAAAFENK